MVKKITLYERRYICSGKWVSLLRWTPGFIPHRQSPSPSTILINAEYMCVHVCVLIHTHSSVFFTHTHPCTYTHTHTHLHTKYFLQTDTHVRVYIYIKHLHLLFSQLFYFKGNLFTYLERESVQAVGWRWGDAEGEGDRES